ncbi:MAG: DUF4382 domain-containing protein [Gemmatimonadota bacterium]|nr:DUF4382 domain-containing protein [Gemmatimonadota bacterium]
MPRPVLGLLALALSLSVVACDDDTTTVGDPGTVSLMLTDAPGDFTQARVTIESVELVGDGDPLVLRDTPFTTDLLTLANDVATLVEDETVEAGTYTQLRFIIPEACIGVEQEDGSEQVYASDGFDECGTPDGGLQLPSFEETGIKVNLPGGSIQVDGDAQILLLDFDVSESFGQQAGASGTWVMTPVINAEDISLTGSIIVELTAADSVDLTTVEASLSDFEARLDTEAAPQAFEDPDQDGTFTASFLFLLPDEERDVTIALQEEDSFDFTLNPTAPQSVSLSSGAESTISFEVTSVSTP